MKRERFGQIIAVVGMQWGSEGKGAIVSYLSNIVTAAVRTGAANAGHTIFFNGKPFVMRQLPCSWINPYAKLVIGSGAIISKDILLTEIETVHKILPVKHRIYIDPRAHVTTEEFISREAHTDLAARIGSTSARSNEGIGATRAAKVMRDSSCLQAKDVPEFAPYIFDTIEYLNKALNQDQYVLLEGTQGLSLSLDHGEFPFVTSADCSTAALAASAGLSTHEFPIDVIGVVRTYPIRVAGNSGSFGFNAKELSWSEIATRAGAKVDLTERTSVTQLPRRVAEFNDDEFRKACLINRPTELALTFADYLDWSIHEQSRITPPVDEFIERIEELSEAEVTLVKTGPHSIIDFDSYRRSMMRKLS